MTRQIRCCGGLLEVIEIIDAAALRRLVRRLAAAFCKSLFYNLRRLCGAPEKWGVCLPHTPLSRRAPFWGGRQRLSHRGWRKLPAHKQTKQQ